MNARPVIQAGSERPDRKKIEVRLDRQPRDETDSEHDHEVGGQDPVVDGA